MSGRARVGLVAIAVIAGVFIAVYFWRLEVATRAIQRVLEERGVPSPMLRVSALGLSGITIRDIRLGEPAEFEAALLRANYAWWNSDAGLPTLEIQDAQWSIDLREGAAPFGALQGPLDALFAPSEEAASAAAPILPALQVEKSRLRIRMADSNVDLLVDLDLAAAGGDGVIEGGVRLESNAPAVGDLRLSRATASIPLRIFSDARATTIMWKGGTFECSNLQVGDVALEGTTKISLPSGDLVLVGNGDSSKQPRFTTEIEISTLTVPGTDGSAGLALRGVAGRLSGHLADGGFTGTLTGSAEAVSLVKQRIAMRNVVVDIPLPFSTRPLRMSKAVLFDLDPEARFPSTEIELTLSRPSTESAWQIGGEAKAASGQIQATFDASVNTDNTGDFRIDFVPLRFERGGLQPETLQAGFGVLRDVDGTLDAHARITWTADGFGQSEGEIQVANLSFRGPTARIEGLTGSMQIASLFPLRSEPHQELEALALHTGGLKFEDARARYQLLQSSEDTSLRLQLDEASLRLGHGTLRVVDATLEPAAPRTFTVRAEKLRLEELARLLDVAEIAGTGTISGAIPVRIEGEAIQIDGGVLQSEGPGVLNIRADFARKALQSAGETAAQVGQALEDFHYERLRITIDKPFQGTSQLGVHALGMNPEVLEGQPFDLHINIETDLEPLLRAASLGLRVPAEWSRRNIRQSQQ